MSDEIKKKVSSESTTTGTSGVLEQGIFVLRTYDDVDFLIPTHWSVGEMIFIDSHDSARIVRWQKRQFRRLAKQYTLWTKGLTAESEKMVAIQSDYQDLIQFLKAPTPPKKVVTPVTMYGEYVGSVAGLIGGVAVELNAGAEAKPADVAAMAELHKLMGLFARRDLITSTKTFKKHGPYRNLHNGWLGRDVPGEFRRLLGQIADDDTHRVWCAALWAEAEKGALPFGATAKPAKKTVSASLNTSSSTDTVAPTRVAIWIRRVKPTEVDPKDMPDDLVAVILEEFVIAAASRLAPKTPWEVVVLGDPVMKVTAIQAALSTACTGTSVRGTLVDLRGFTITSAAKPKPCPFAAFHAKTPAPLAFKRPDLFGTETASTTATTSDEGTTALDEKSTDKLTLVPEKGYLTHLNRWVFFHYLCHAKQLKFVVGCEAGNMDPMAHAGTPIISIDNPDATVDTAHSVITDRIGEYGRMSPLWQVLNWGQGTKPALFRPYLRGTMLRYLVTSAGTSTATKGKGTGATITAQTSTAEASADLIIATTNKAETDKAAAATTRFHAWLTENNFVEGAATGVNNNCAVHCMFQFGDVGGQYRGRQPADFAPIRKAYDYDVEGVAIDFASLGQQAIDQGLAITVYVLNPKTGEVKFGGRVGLDEKKVDTAILCTLLHINSDEGGHFEPLWPA